MDQFKEIPPLESLLNFHKDACNICYIPSKCYHFTLQNGKQWQKWYSCRRETALQGGSVLAKSGWRYSADNI